VSSKVNCPRCGQTFDVPDETGRSWGECPHCHAANPEAMTVLDPIEPVKQAPAIAITAAPSAATPAPASPPVAEGPPSHVPGCAGVFLLVVGGLTLTVGTFLCWLGITLNPGKKSAAILITVIWAAGSLAVIASGWWLVSPARKRMLYATIWGPGFVFLVVMLLGFCAWIVAFATCMGTFD
jgi:hypothetical protein